MNTKSKSATKSAKTVKSVAEITSTSSLKLGAKRRAQKRGSKAKVYALIPAKGAIRVSALVKQASKIKVPATKVQAWLPVWRRAGYISIAA